MPETGWMTGEPAEPDPPYDWRRVEILLDGLTRNPPRDFAAIFEMAGDGHEHELRAAVGMAVNYIKDQLATYPSDSAQYWDAATRADELQRLTTGDD
jgi:hypothetical protein